MIVDTKTAKDIEQMRAALEFYADEKNYAPGRWVVNGLTRPVLQDGGNVARAALQRS